MTFAEGYLSQHAAARKDAIAELRKLARQIDHLADKMEDGGLVSASGLISMVAGAASAVEFAKQLEAAVRVVGVLRRE